MKHIAILIIAAGLLLSAVPAFADEGGQMDQSLRRGETRATLNPMQFSHPTVQAAYAVARKIPWVLDSIYCYCFCEENPYFMHKSLLSCYVDDHAANWTTCLGEALRAFEYYKAGKSVAEIKALVEKEFKRSRR